MILAKLAVYGLAGALAGLAAAATALAVTAAWWAAKGAAFPLSAAGTWRVLGGGIAANAAFAAIGVGVGALVRNVVAAVAAALAWVALVEGIAGQLLGSGLARGPPFYASEALDRANLTPATRLLPQWGGGLVLLGYAAAFAGAAVLTTLNRDVTEKACAVLRDRDDASLPEYLIATAARLIDERGSAGLSVRDIAREAKVADGARTTTSRTRMTCWRRLSWLMWPR